MKVPFHAVIGRSAMGLINASLLVNRPARTAPIALIGDDSPWLRYRDHEMGQPACFLALPGFTAALPDAALRSSEPLRSDQFQDLLRAQECLLSHKATIYRARVDAVEKRNRIFHLKLQNGDTVEASQIDLCLGPGLARVPDAIEIDDPHALWLPWVRSVWHRDPDPPSQCPVRSAEQFLGAADRTQARALRVAVAGAGGVAWQCVDEALGNGFAASVLWIDPNQRRETWNPANIRPSRLRERLQARHSQIDIRIGENVSLALDHNRIEAKIGVHTHEVDLLIVAMGALPDRAWIPPKLADLAPPLAFASDWPDGVHVVAPIALQQLREDLGNALPAADYLGTLWKELPGPGIRTADHRLLPIQAAHLAAYRGCQPIPGRILNANTAFYKEMEDLRLASPLIRKRRENPILHHADARVRCWYAGPL